MAKRVTAQDVATASGVSQATVSYVVNGVEGKRISEETRTRVLATAARLGYVPNESARALRLGRSNIALLAIADVQFSHGIDRLVASLATELGVLGTTLVLHRATDSTSLRDVCRGIAPSVVLSLGEMEDEERTSILAAGIDVAIIRLRVQKGGGEHVDADFQEVLGRLQIEHLAAHGHAVLGYAMPADPRLQSFSQPRLDGALDRAAHLALAAPLVEVVDVDLDSAERAILGWRAQGVTAVAAYNDDIALALLGAAWRLGVRVPDDLAVIGVDAAPIGAVSTPPLTSVDIDTANLASQFVKQFATRSQSEHRGVLYEPLESLHATVLERSSV